MSCVVVVLCLDWMLARSIERGGGSDRLSDDDDALGGGDIPELDAAASRACEYDAIAARLGEPDGREYAWI